VDDALGVGMSHGVADATEQVEPGSDRKPPLVAPAIDRLAVDQLHHEIGDARRRHAAVNQSGDIGMVDRPEDPALLAEAADDPLRFHPGPNELQRDQVILRLVTSRDIDAAHSALGKLAQDHVIADPGSGRGRSCWRHHLGEQRQRELRGGGFEKTLRRVARGQ
jgi:hypothetical protein